MNEEHIRDFERKYDVICVPRTHLASIDNLSKLMVLVATETIKGRFLSEDVYEKNAGLISIQGKASNQLGMRRTRVLLRVIRKYAKDTLKKVMEKFGTNVIAEIDSTELYAFLDKFVRQKTTNQGLRYKITDLFRNELFTYKERQENENNMHS